MLISIVIYQIDALFKRIEICMNEKDVDEEKANIIEKVKEEKKTDGGSAEIEVEKEVEKEVEVSARGRGPLKVRTHTHRSSHDCCTCMHLLCPLSCSDFLSPSSILHSPPFFFSTVLHSSTPSLPLIPLFLVYTILLLISVNALLALIPLLPFLLIAFLVICSSYFSSCSRL
jgi:hypothetical protein